MQYGFFQDTVLKFKPIDGYQSNSLGYRTNEIVKKDLSNAHWYIIGESNCFGIGINDGERFSDRLENKFKQLVYNLSRPGASTNECVRILFGMSEYAQFHPPRGVIIVWPYFLRRNLYDINKPWPEYLTGSINDKDFIKHIINNTDSIDIANFLNQQFFVEFWAKTYGTKVYHFCVDQKNIDLLQSYNLFSQKICPVALSDCAPNDDLASDNAHWGNYHHKIFAITIEQWIANN